MPAAVEIRPSKKTKRRLHEETKDEIDETPAMQVVRETLASVLIPEIINLIELSTLPRLRFATPEASCIHLSTNGIRAHKVEDHSRHSWFSVISSMSLAKLALPETQTFRWSVRCVDASCFDLMFLESVHIGVAVPERLPNNDEHLYDFDNAYVWSLNYSQGYRAYRRWHNSNWSLPLNLNKNKLPVTSLDFMVDFQTGEWSAALNQETMIRVGFVPIRHLSNLRAYVSFHHDSVGSLELV